MNSVPSVFLMGAGLDISKSCPTYTRPLVETCDWNPPLGTKMLPMADAAGSSVALSRWVEYVVAAPLLAGVRVVWVPLACPPRTVSCVV